MTLARSVPAQKPGKSRQDYGTPLPFIRAVEARFGSLDWDLAAHARNSRCGEFFYGPGSKHAEDSFSVVWAARHPKGNLWLNPPFSDIAPWAEKCADEAKRRRGLIFLLTPASIGSEWFAEHVHRKAMVLALRPRLSFDGKAPYPKDLILAVHGLGLHGFDTWRWDRAAS